VVKGYGKTIPQSEILASLSRPGPCAILLTSALWQQIELNSNFSQPAWKVFRAEGFNAAKGSFIDLTLVVKP